MCIIFKISKFHENPLILVRFGLLPYGSDNPDTRAFPPSPEDVPGGPYEFLNSGDHGDYLTKKDNKPNPIRKSRQLFAGAYMPPTK